MGGSMSSSRSRLRRPGVGAHLVALLAVVLVASPTTGRTPDGTVDLAVPRSAHTATLRPDGSVLVVGGSDGVAALASVERIDLEAKTTEIIGALDQARSAHTATALTDGRVLIAGGTTDGAALASTELLDPATGTSQPTGDLTWPRTEHAAVLLEDGRVLLVGGVADGKPVARAELFDPTTGATTPAARSKAVHRDATATVLPNGKVLVTGTATKKKAPAAELYDPATDKWSALDKAPKATGHVATRLPDGRVLLTGGSMKKAQLFDPAKGRFAGAPALAAQRTDHTATPLLSGGVLIVGGTQVQDEVSTLELFDADADTFETIGEAMIPRTGHTTTALPDGRALVVGGTWAGLPLGEVLVYDPDTRELEPLGDAATSAEPSPRARSKADVLTDLGPPDAFLILYPERAEDATAEPVSLETWTWYDSGLELTFEGDALVAEEGVEAIDDVIATPYDPDSFEAWMSLDEVLAAAGVEDRYGGPMDDAETKELWFAEQLAWGLDDGELRYIEGIALGAREDEG